MRDHGQYTRDLFFDGYLRNPRDRGLAANVDDGRALVDECHGAGNAFVFSPNTVTIHAGGYVRWVNVSALTTHTVTRP